VSFHFQIILNTLGVSSIPGEKHLKGCGPRNVVSSISKTKVFGRISWYSHFFLFYCGQLALETWPSMLDTCGMSDALHLNADERSRKNATVAGLSKNHTKAVQHEKEYSFPFSQYRPNVTKNRHG
jgi:hypothetical protein